MQQLQQMYQQARAAPPQGGMGGMYPGGPPQAPQGGQMPPWAAMASQQRGAGAPMTGTFAQNPQLAQGLGMGGGMIRPMGG